MAKTKIDLLVDKLIQLTNDDYLAWKYDYHEKYGHLKGISCEVPGGLIYLPMESLSKDVLAVETSEGFVSLFSPSELLTLKRAIEEHYKMDANYAVQKVIEGILEGEVENGDKGTEQVGLGNQEGQEGQS